jgi:uncharacterized SAM-binding protein YcdF (DUF218 family)
MLMISHLLQPWILPPGINILLIVCGMLIACRLRKSGICILLIGIMSLWMLSAPIVAYNFIDLLQTQYPILNLEQLRKNKLADAIVILGGGDTVEAEYGNKRTVSDFTFHRIEYAVYLHRNTKLPIIVSGGSERGASESEADLMANVLKNDFNIAASIKEDQSHTTADESQFIAMILKKKHFKTIYLVTDAWHMPRSVYIFKCAGIDVVPAPMGQYIYGPGYALISYLPNIDALHASSLAMHEWIGLMWYRMRFNHHCIE